MDKSRLKYRKDLVEVSGPKVEQRTLKWRLHKFHLWREHNVAAYDIDLFPSSEWRFLVYPYSIRGEDDEGNVNAHDEVSDGEYISLRILKLHLDKNTKVKTRVCIKDCKDEDHYVSTTEFCDGKKFSSVSRIQYAKRAELFQEKAEKLYRDEILIVCFTITVWYPFKKGTLASKNVENNGLKFFNLDCTNTLYRKFEASYQAQTLSDVTVKIFHQEFPVHKIVLAARSLVLYQMLKQMDTNSNVIELTDIATSVASDFIYYMYTDKVKDISMEKAMDLILAARKYQMSHLIDCCVSYICDNISVDNFASALKFSLKYNFWEFVEKLRSFYSRNYVELVLKTDWNKHYMTHLYKEIES